MNNAIDSTFRRWAVALVALLAITFVLAGCGGSDDSTPDTTTKVTDETAAVETTTSPDAATACEDIETPEPKSVDLKKPGKVLAKGEAARAIVHTTCGDFTIELDTEQAPITTNSFAYLAEEGVFDNTAFHRVVPDFVIQGGDPEGSGMGGPGYSVEEAPPGDQSYVEGVVAMAKTEVEPPGTSGSQFFVVTGADVGLPPDYALVGTVSEGMDVVQLIASQADPATQLAPLIPIAIKSVTIEKG